MYNTMHSSIKFGFYAVRHLDLPYTGVGEMLAIAVSQMQQFTDTVQTESLHGSQVKTLGYPPTVQGQV